MLLSCHTEIDTRERGSRRIGADPLLDQQWLEKSTMVSQQYKDMHGGNGRAQRQAAEIRD
jgi:hypothetical protein